MSQRSVKAIRFQYQRGRAPHTFETMPFYLRYLRGFLKRNEGRSVWLKGGKGDQAAYLIFHIQLESTVKRMLGQPLADLGKYVITPIPNPVQLLRKYANTPEKEAIGQITIGALTLGQPVYEEEEEYRIPAWEGVTLCLMNGWIDPRDCADFACPKQHECVDHTATLIERCLAAGVPKTELVSPILTMKTLSSLLSQRVEVAAR